MVIVEDGEPCQGACTGRGHVESYCSGHAADRLARRAARARRPPRATWSSSGIRRWQQIGRHLGAAIGSLVNLFDPDVVVIGGGFGVAAGELLLGPVRETVLREALAPAGERVRLAVAELGPLAGVIGAGLRRVRGDRVGRPMPLAVCATPIGNLGDVTLRVLDELRAADVVLCEDTRHTRLLLDRYGIPARLLSFHEHNEAERTAERAAAARGGRAGRARLGRRAARDLRSRRRRSSGRRSRPGCR